MEKPKIEHATVNEIDERIEIKMDSGYAFYRLDLFPEETTKKEIAYSRYGVFSQDTDFNLFVVVAEDEL